LYTHQASSDKFMIFNVTSCFIYYTYKKIILALIICLLSLVIIKGYYRIYSSGKDLDMQEFEKMSREEQSRVLEELKKAETKVRKVLRFIKNLFFFGIPLRFLMVATAGVALNLFLQLLNPSLETAVHVMSLVVAVVLLLVTGLGVCYFTKVFHDDKDFMSQQLYIKTYAPLLQGVD
jgi:hypothetical protein